MSLETQAALQTAGTRTVEELAAEVSLLREALGVAVQALGRCGITPSAYESQPEAVRGSGIWAEAAQVWRAAGIHSAEGARVVLRCGAAGCVVAKEFTSPEQALEAAIVEIEDNLGYPLSIELEGRTLMDRAAILRAWEDRHDPG